MEASIVDLRYKMKEVLKALKQQESVTILYHGKVAGTIIPVQSEKIQIKVQEHPLFGMRKKSQDSVSKEMERLRSGRYEDI